MKRGKRSNEERTRRKLLELWQSDEDFGAAIGCVATTFTFDAAFFEEECLGRFAGIQSDPNDNARAYVIEREEKLAQCFAAVIVDQTHVPTHRSLRWQVLAARVRGGILHAKLTLLVWQNRIRMLVGSANLTEPGYRRNLENMAVFEFGQAPEDGGPLELLEGALDYLEHARSLAAGAEATSGPQAGLRRFLGTVRRLSSDWQSPSRPRSEPRAHLLDIRPGRPTLFEQLGELNSSRPFHTAMVVSPFYDDGEGCTRVVAALATLLTKRGPRAIHFIASGARLPDGAIELQLPKALKDGGKCTHRFALVEECPDQGRQPGDRALHAKSLWIERDDAAIYCLGSSNFTSAGTGLSRGGGNYELNVAYVLPDRSKFAAIYRQSQPPHQDLDLDEDDVRFLEELPDRTTDADDLSGLPLAFGEAIYDPSHPATLRLDIDSSAPVRFQISTDDGTQFLDSSDWRTLGATTPWIRPWSLPKPPSHLLVTWHDEYEERRSVWPVNVVDPSHLPPPEELLSLDLEELLQVLTSARPPHETVIHLLTRRSRGTPPNAQEMDPHRRVDTRGFLLQRMRRFSNALEGLRERLERPAHSIESLCWRLHGPFGVRALANRLVQENAEEAAFLIAELASAVAAVKLTTGGDLTESTVQQVRSVLLRELRDMAKQRPGHSSLLAYVDETFREIAP